VLGEQFLALIWVREKDQKLINLIKKKERKNQERSRIGGDRKDS
jgi:hypothetical protein